MSLITLYPTSLFRLELKQRAIIARKISSQVQLSVLYLSTVITLIHS